MLSGFMLEKAGTPVTDGLVASFHVDELVDSRVQELKSELVSNPL